MRAKRLAGHARYQATPHEPEKLPGSALAIKTSLVDRRRARCMRRSCREYEYRAIHRPESHAQSAEPCEHVVTEKFLEETPFEAALPFAVPKVT